MTMYDYSTAERSSFDIIPAKTTAPAMVAVRAGSAGTPENAFTITKTDLYQLTLEFTLTEGEYANRKIFHRLTTGAKPGTELTAGQETGINIGKQFLRALLEAGRGYAPTDESAAAIEARRMSSIFELDGLEVWVEIGIEKGRDGYDDRNKIMKILPTRKSTQGGAATPPVKAAASAKPASAPAKTRSW